MRDEVEQGAKRRATVQRVGIAPEGPRADARRRAPGQHRLLAQADRSDTQDLHVVEHLVDHSHAVGDVLVRSDVAAADVDVTGMAEPCAVGARLNTDVVHRSLRSEAQARGLPETAVPVCRPERGSGQEHRHGAAEQGPDRGRREVPIRPDDHGIRLGRIHLVNARESKPITETVDGGSKLAVVQVHHPRQPSHCTTVEARRRAGDRTAVPGNGTALGICRRRAD